MWNGQSSVWCVCDFLSNILNMITVLHYISHFILIMLQNRAKVWMIVNGIEYEWKLHMTWNILQLYYEIHVYVYRWQCTQVQRSSQKAWFRCLYGLYSIFTFSYVTTQPKVVQCDIPMNVDNVFYLPILT